MISLDFVINGSNRLPNSMNESTKKMSSWHLCRNGKSLRNHVLLVDYIRPGLTFSTQYFVLEQERIAALHSELARLRAQLAADAGNEDLMAFFFREKEEDVSYIEDLRNRVTYGFPCRNADKLMFPFSAAESRASALEQSFAMFDDDHPDIMKHIKAETEAREQLADITKQLEKYQSIYGDLSQLPPDVQGLEAQLRLKEDEVQRLQLVDKQRAQVSRANMFRRRPF
jgi:hypothetical protein